MKKQLDQCLGSTDSLDTTKTAISAYDKATDGVYHYTTYTPCIYGGERSQLSFMCDTDPTCKKSPTLIFDSITSTSDREIRPIGIAKDGRIMYGPYLNATYTWDPCDVDTCNGRWN